DRVGGRVQITGDDANLSLVIHERDDVPIIVCFFQAEDGIRDSSVTGVQTCALPISAVSYPGPSLEATNGFLSATSPLCAKNTSRSEERRVGKECRSRWTRDHLKKKCIRR